MGAFKFVPKSKKAKTPFAEAPAQIEYVERVVEKPVEVLKEVVRVVEKPVEVVKEVHVEKEVIKYVDRIVEKPIEIIKEVVVEKPVEVLKEVQVELPVEVRIPYVQQVIPYWARWAAFIAVIEAIMIAFLLEAK